MAYVKIDKSKRGYVKFVRGLRDKYKVDVPEDIVKRRSIVSHLMNVIMRMPLYLYGMRAIFPAAVTSMN